ncbi:MAG: RagB/SusD family nutrient uptake outer membrane protein [Saprospiraceae bacterium]|nr:RagB/SusD family nutrient uptake outer membrane protein [Saprospiraceae bacterium]
MKNIKFLSTLLIISAGLFYSSCSKEEYLNPSQATEPSVVKDVNGLIALANGLQRSYSVSRLSPIYSTITASGLSTNELIVLNAGNTDEANLEAGKGNVQGNNAVVSRLWEQSHIIKANADLILRNLSIVGDESLRNGILCYANLYKGLALLQLGTYWEQAPIGIGKNAEFSARTAVLNEAIKLFEQGRDAANSGKLTIDGRFQTGINFSSAFSAMAARTYLMLGNNDKALEEANKVNLTSKSEFSYDDIARNPIFEVSYSNVNVCEPKDADLGLSGALKPDENDGRILFYLKSKVFTTTANEGKGFFTSFSSKIPLYLPGEIMLIKAEAFARKNDLNNAITELNKVLTKTDDGFGVNAALPAYSGSMSQNAILEAIYKNRCIELYNSGLKLEDSRRFGRPGPLDANAERTRNFYPYPNSERDNNTSTPSDPDI